MKNTVTTLFSNTKLVDALAKDREKAGILTQKAFATVDAKEFFEFIEDLADHGCEEAFRRIELNVENPVVCVTTTSFLLSFVASVAAKRNGLEYPTPEDMACAMDIMRDVYEALPIEVPSVQTVLCRLRRNWAAVHARLAEGQLGMDAMYDVYGGMRYDEIADDIIGMSKLLYQADEYFSDESKEDLTELADLLEKLGKLPQEEIGAIEDPNVAALVARLRALAA